MEWHNRTVAVVGLGVSNLAVIRYLAGRGARLVGFDQKTEAALDKTTDELKALGVRLVLGPDYLSQLDGPWDAVVLTPGMPKNIPVLQRLRERGVPFFSEIGLFFSLCKARIVGITGSSGKTTTTTLIGEMLRRGQQPVYVGGNIGRPLVEVAEEIPPDAWVVLELSSFQLEMLDQSPHIALVTNVTPNHLDVHETMDAYIAAKRRIYEFQTAADVAVFNGDDDTTRQMAAASPGTQLSFSRRGEQEAGAWVDGDHIVVRIGRGEGNSGEPTVVCRRSDIVLPGEHNVENVLAAVTVAAACGLDVEHMRAAVAEFTGVRHRLELVGQWNGVRFYNDSIATSPARAVAGIRAFSAPIVLIAGGYDKQLPFDELAAALPGRVHTVVLLGATAGKIEQAIEAHTEKTGAAPPRIVRVASLDEAVEQARLAAHPGDVVLLSPACASYDMFPNFEVRGDRFRELTARFAEPHVAAK